ncbi:hypothetical protein HanIR_Chr05g0213791 [Helianthus annuus]|nr:hypothetical protein HanIR_Chr05g0213791 [Helianthus annuus]
MGRWWLIYNETKPKGVKWDMNVSSEYLKWKNPPQTSILKLSESRSVIKGVFLHD